MTIRLLSLLLALALLTGLSAVGCVSVDAPENGEDDEVEVEESMRTMPTPVGELALAVRRAPSRVWA